MIDRPFPTRSSTEVLERLEYSDQSLVLVGQPGSGKTTLLQFLRQELLNRDHVVVFITLRNTRDLVGNIARELAEQTKIDSHELLPNDTLGAIESEVRARHIDVPSVLNHTLELVERRIHPSRRIFFLLDGLDEVARSDAREINKVIESIPLYSSRAQVVVTSRPGEAAERLAKRFRQFELGRLQDAEVVELLQRHFAERPTTVDRRIINEIVELSEGLPLAVRLLIEVFETTGAVSKQAVHGLALRQVSGALSAVPPSVASAEEVTLLLQLIAIEGGGSLSRLTRLLAIPVDRLRAAIELLDLIAIQRDERESVDFVSQYLRDAFLKSQVTPQKIDPGTLAFGDEAAERDPLLEGRFIPRPDLQRIALGEKTIVLGDRGAGKSAVFKKLQESSIGTLPANPLLISATDDPNTFVQQMMAAPGSTTAGYFKAVWLLYCAALAAKNVQVLADPRLDAKYLRAAWSILRNVGWTSSIRGEPFLSHVFAAVRSILPSSVGFSVGPVTIEPTWLRKRSGSSLQVIEFLDETDRLLLRLKKKFVMAFDQIDEVFKYERAVQEALVQGLFLAEAYLSQSAALRLAVLLRTDLYELYDIQEKNKFVSRTIALEWNERELLELIRVRACANECLGRVKEIAAMIDERSSHGTEVTMSLLFPRTVEGADFTTWFFDALRNGNRRVSPRQVILFLNLARTELEKEVRGGSGRVLVPLFSEANVANAMTLISDLSYDEVISDFRVATSFVRNCRAGKVATFELSDVEGLFDLGEGAPAKQVESLERLGFIERIVVGGAARLVSRFRIPPLFTRCWDQRVQ